MDQYQPLIGLLLQQFKQLTDPKPLYYLKQNDSSSQSHYHTQKQPQQGQSEIRLHCIGRQEEKISKKLNFKNNDGSKYFDHYILMKQANILKLLIDIVDYILQFKLKNIGLQYLHFMINKKHLKFYRVDNFKGHLPFLAPSSISIADLIIKVESSHTYKQFQIFLQSQLIQTEQKNLALQQIVKQKHLTKDIAPTFYIFQFCSAVEKENQQMAQYYESIVELLRLEGSTKSQWRGANGHVLFEGRDNSLIASSYKQSTKLHKSNSVYCINANEALAQGDNESLEKKNNKSPQEIKEIKKLISFLKEKQSKEELVNYKAKYDVDKKYSNFDINFVTTLERTYLTYMLRSGCRLSYIQYRQWEFAVIERRINKNDKIGIIGDYGTGLEDSFELMENMVIGCGVNIILHLGDVYYAGTPEEYENNVASILKSLRIKSNKNILFYSIPGNHDYYSWGMPFLCFIKEINSQEFTKQKASYFCLRSQDNKWQFLGADTAFHDSNPFDQINQTNPGPRLRKQELAWHRQKLQNFDGSTIFLSHHQLFSIHDRLCGSLSQYRHFSCINPLISKQLFEYMPYFSAWYWGHQHAFMLFQDNFWGVPKCRLLGNSSFHVIFDKEHPYYRKSQFPKIPFITDDSTYLKKFLPVNPNKSSIQLYFNLCFGVIDMSKSQENLSIDYYCSPSYNSASKKQFHFKYYKIYEEIIESKNNIIKKSEIISKQRYYFLKNQIGLLLDCNNNKFILNFKGTPIAIHPVKQKNHLQDEAQIYLLITASFLSSEKEKIVLESLPTERCIWTFKKTKIMHEDNNTITHLNTFSIRNESEMKFLSFTLQNGTPSIGLAKQPALWQFLRLQDSLPNLSD